MIYYPGIGLVYGRNVNICLEFEFKSQVPITGIHKHLKNFKRNRSISGNICRNSEIKDILS